jgi:hypothetical protein
MSARSGPAASPRRITAAHPTARCTPTSSSFPDSAPPWSCVSIRKRAERHRLFDPVTIAVRDRATLAAWDEYLTGQGIAHSEVITAIQAWLIVVPDPDDHRLRLYTLETHGPELAPMRITRGCAAPDRMSRIGSDERPGSVRTGAALPAGVSCCWQPR